MNLSETIYNIPLINGKLKDKDIHIILSKEKFEELIFETNGTYPYSDKIDRQILIMCIAGLTYHDEDNYLSIRQRR